MLLTFVDQHWFSSNREQQTDSAIPYLVPVVVAHCVQITESSHFGPALMQLLVACTASMYIHVNSRRLIQRRPNHRVVQWWLPPSYCSRLGGPRPVRPESAIVPQPGWKDPYTLDGDHFHFILGLQVCSELLGSFFTGNVVDGEVAALGSELLGHERAQSAILLVSMKWCCWWEAVP